MEFSLSEETTMLKESAERFLRENCPASLVKALNKDESGFSETLWKKMAELGWLGLIYGEQYGGLDGSFFDWYMLFEEMGKVLFPSPFFCSAVLSALIIREAGDQKTKEEFLPSIIRGERIWTTALLGEQGRLDQEDPQIKAQKGPNNSYRLSGTRLLVPYAQVADEIIVCARIRGKEAQGPTLFRINGKAEGLEKIWLNTLTEEKTYALILNQVKVSADHIIGEVGKGHYYLKRVFPWAVALKCGEMVGGLERVVDMTVKYVKDRHQFGKPLGSLQAVQHFCTDMATYLETSRWISRQAAYFLNEGIPGEKEVAMAKAWVSDAYKKTTWIAQQLHGGIGFTEEYDLHLYYKHAKASELAFEGSWFHRSTVADHLGL
jgi:alkylation response protein AidB-like acyl-CoA dehydrogenase